MKWESFVLLLNGQYGRKEVHDTHKQRLLHVSSVSLVARQTVSADGKELCTKKRTRKYITDKPSRQQVSKLDFAQARL